MAWPVPIDLKNAVMYIRDASTHYIEVRIGEGNLTYATKRNIVRLDARGLLDRVREGKEEPCEVNFQFVWDHIITHNSDLAVSVEDALNFENGASGWLSTNPDEDAPKSVDIQLQHTPVCSADIEVVFFHIFNYEDLSHSLKDATVDCKGTCNVVRPIPYVPA